MTQSKAIPDFNYEQLSEYCQCPYRFWLRRTGASRTGPKNLVGNITGRAVEQSMSSPPGTPRKFRPGTAAMPETERARTEDKIALCLAAIERFKETAPARSLMQEQLSWLDPDGRFEIFAKPDQISIHPSESLVEIIEYKTTAKLRHSDKRRLFFFAFVYAMSTGTRRRIKLEIRLLGRAGGLPDSVNIEDCSIAFWYSHKLTARWLEWVETTVDSMHQSASLSDYQAKPGRHCLSCPYRNACRFRYQEI